VTIHSLEVEKIGLRTEKRVMREEAGKGVKRREKA